MQFVERADDMPSRLDRALPRTAWRRARINADQQIALIRRYAKTMVYPEPDFR